MTASSQPRISRARKLLYAFAVVAGAMLLLEGGSRCYYRVRTGGWAIPTKYFPPQSLRYLADAHLAHVHQPGANYRINHKQISINSLGFRGEEVDVPKPSGRLRVACLGGSTTFDTRVTTDADAWPAQLERRLREERPDLDVEVVNCGVPGYTTAESLGNLALRVLDLEPDLVVVYHTWNDLKPAQEPGFLSDYSHWRRPSADAPTGWLERVKLNSLVYLKLSRQLRRARASRSRDAVLARSARTAVLGEEHELAFRRNLESIVALCRGSSIETALCTFATRSSQFEEPPSEDFDSPYAPNFTPEELQRGFRRYADVIRETAAEKGVWLVDAQRLMPHGDVFADYVHFADEGARLMAGVVYDELDRQGAWDRLARRVE